jgi:hypothetical protein
MYLPYAYTVHLGEKVGPQLGTLCPKNSFLRNLSNPFYSTGYFDPRTLFPIVQINVQYVGLPKIDFHSCSGHKASNQSTFFRGDTSKVDAAPDRGKKLRHTGVTSSG